MEGFKILVMVLGCVFIVAAIGRGANKIERAISKQDFDVICKEGSTCVIEDD